ncbi:hypothetical protein KIN20_023470 [Parelaphostrongylus tenuis]|uniref:SET domain-containing protein n=1 Tax=Parelaphostrongylus tenuis TaxID=148309 RepID=A0AAD5N929_PARTN|nr:hypothetical protein KIN20_023470 [Parelaphostrongylus tenuis]
MSGSCGEESSAAEESLVSSSSQQISSESFSAGPEPETSEQLERESCGAMSPNEVEQATNDPHTSYDDLVVNTTGSTPVKRFVIADSDDDITDDEDDFDYSKPDEERFNVGDHNYAVTYNSNPMDHSRSSEVFPLIPGLSELGLTSDDLEIANDQHMQGRTFSTAQVGYEQREPNIINRAPSNVRDSIYRATDGQNSYFARSSRPGIHTSTGYRGVQVPQDRGLPLPQHQQQHFIVAGYNATPMARRVLTTTPMSSPSAFQQKRTAPRIVSTPAHLRPQSARLSATPNILMQSRQTSAMSSAPPIQRQVDPPPHRTLHQGSDPPPHRVLLLQGNAGSRVAFSPADPSQAALANAPAPLIISSRGTRPIVRGRGGSAAGRGKKENSTGVPGEDVSPAHSPQHYIPMNTPSHGNRATPVSSRKQVHFSDGVALGTHSADTSSSFRVQGSQPNTLSTESDFVSNQNNMRSPPKVVMTHVRSPTASVASYHGSTMEVTDHALPSRTSHIAQETSSLPENFVDVEGGAEYSDVACKNPTLPPDVIAAATSLSAHSDVSHPQWTNNDISEEDIKAKIEAISREIAQELEQKRMESEAQIKEKRRPMADTSSVRRRSVNETQFTGGEQGEPGEPAPVLSRGRGRPKGSGRTRSSLSSSSSTSASAPNTTPSYHDVPDLPSSTARTTEYQSLRSPGRSSVRTTLPSTKAYDGSMAPDLPPPLPPIADSVPRNRGTYHNAGLASPSQVHSQKIPGAVDTNIQNYQQKNVNGFHQDDDLANVSTDPSSDEEEAAEETEWGDYVTRCLCEMQHNDEWMVECEQCNVWQHMKCMGIDPKKFNENDTYLCESCRPRPLKYSKKQAQELQMKQLKAVAREKERKMLEKLKRREERKRAKLNLRLKEQNQAKTTARRGPAAFKKFQMIQRNEYTKRAKQMLALFDTTAGAQSILDNSLDLRRGKRMFVAPDVEGLVATETIKQDDVIMEYIGQVCLPDECPGRLQRGALQPFCVLYNGLGQNLLCIDARRQGSDARFARRCCRSNSTLKHVLLDGCIYVMLVASEKIDKGTEVTIPFDCDFRDTLVPVECACGDDPNCYMKHFNNTLRGKASFEERDFSSPTRPSNGATSGRKTSSSPQKNKVDGRGRPKGSGKKEKSSEILRKKGKGNKKAKKIRIRLHRHSDNKNTKTSDDSVGQGGVERENERKVETVEEKKVKVEPSSSVPTKEGVQTTETKKKNDESLGNTTPQQINNKTTEIKKATPESPKKEEHQTGAKRRSSMGSGRSTKREAVELKELMDYTLPEDRNKPSREERKLQAVVAAFEKKEEKEKKKKAEAHKDASDVKDKKGAGRLSKSGASSTVRRTGRASESSADKLSKEKNEETATEQPARENPRAKKKKEDFKENEIVEATTIAQPPRKRWAAAVKENEVTQRASSPEVTSSSSTPSAGAPDILSAYAVNPNTVGGKKLWLRRHAAESVSDESLQAPDISATSEPQSCAADSTSDIATVPSKLQSSPLKKRRHILDACQDDEHVAATALAQMGGKSAEGFRFHWSVALRYVMSTMNDLKNMEFRLAEVVRKPLPLPSSRNASKISEIVTVDTSTDTPTSSQMQEPSTNEVKKAKRLSLEDYKRRRSTMGSSDNKNVSSRITSQNAPGSTTSDRKNHIGENINKPTRSFIPSMDSVVEQNLVLPPLDTDNPIPSLGVPPDLEVVKKMILQESCIPPPPAPPSLPTQKDSSINTALPSSSDMSIGSSSESGEERMSLADRLAKEFGVGTAGTHRHSPKATPSGQRLMVTTDTPPPPPPGPRPTRSTR